MATLHHFNNRWYIAERRETEFCEPFSHILRWELHATHYDTIDDSWEGAYAQGDYARNTSQWWYVRHPTIPGFTRHLTTPEVGEITAREPIKPPRGHSTYRWAWDGGRWRKVYKRRWTMAKSI